ncbi:hypothetical protein GvMRE_IIg351 [endosymbiont GvMRE of Glomus versiforme]|nr:hypothetical protein GvMRE_IIg351 [endosymbiont GvMRE of Glomus versiforme]
MAFEKTDSVKFTWIVSKDTPYTQGLLLFFTLNDDGTPGKQVASVNIKDIRSEALTISPLAIFLENYTPGIFKCAVAFKNDATNIKFSKSFRVEGSESNKIDFFTLNLQAYKFILS